MRATTGVRLSAGMVQVAPQLASSSQPVVDTFPHGRRFEPVVSGSIDASLVASTEDGGIADDPRRRSARHVSLAYGTGPALSATPGDLAK
jgi:hypothetical protein